MSMGATTRQHKRSLRHMLCTKFHIAGGWRLGWAGVLLKQYCRTTKLNLRAKIRPVITCRESSALFEVSNGYSSTHTQYTRIYVAYIAVRQSPHRNYRCAGMCTNFHLDVAICAILPSHSMAAANFSSCRSHPPPPKSTHPSTT